MTVTQDLVTIPLADIEVIALLREEPLTAVIGALRRRDPRFRAHEAGPLLDAAGLHVGPRSCGPTARFLGLDGHPREFHRIAAAIQLAAAAVGWM
jgi:hypothetical protein